MAYQMEWWVPQRVIFVRVTGKLTVDTLEGGSTTVSAMLDQAIAPAYLCADLTGIESYPVQATQMADMAVFFRHPHLACTVLYGASSLRLETGIRIVTLLTRARHQMVESRAEALRFLAAQDPTIAEYLARSDLSGSD